jgi:fructosamine-3-kinase
MADKPINPVVELSHDEAASILRAWLGDERQVLAVQRLTGGCVHTVLGIEFEGDESPVIFKVAHRVGEGSIQGEHDILRYFRQHTEFPVPEPYACDLSGEVVPYSWLIMERLEGGHLGDAHARMTEVDAVRLQVLMGESVGRLHSHTRETGFGRALEGKGAESWTDWFTDLILRHRDGAAATGLLDERDLEACDRAIEAIPEHLDRGATPTLVHGDIWATNVMVAGEPGSLYLSGFLDPGGIFADPEYELAYLQIWRTVSGAFFEAYAAHHDVAEGYELRRLFYWLNTLLQHVRAFKTDTYAEATSQLARRLGAAL